MSDSELTVCDIYTKTIYYTTIVCLCCMLSTIFHLVMRTLPVHFSLKKVFHVFKKCI